VSGSRAAVRMLSNRIVQDVIVGRMKQATSLNDFSQINAPRSQYGCHKFKAQVVLLAGLVAGARLFPLRLCCG
jgi:hypothetical protein